MPRARAAPTCRTGHVPLEVKNGLSNVRGTVGLARGDEPDSGGADFFINVGDESPLDAAKDVPGNTTGYAVFGKVIGGLGVVDAINKVKTGGDGPMPGQAPMMPIVISKVTIVPGTIQIRRRPQKRRPELGCQKEKAIRRPGMTSRGR